MKLFSKINVFVLLGVFIFIFSFSGCSNEKEDSGYVFKEEDFSLTISANRTTDVSAGDNIEITAVLKNLSGQNIEIESFTDSIEGVISIYVVEDPQVTDDSSMPGGAFRERKSFSLKKDISLTKTMNFIVAEGLNSAECYAIASFYIGSDSYCHAIRSNNLKFYIKENLLDKSWEAGLYSLNDVYEGGGITYDDLLNIAYHSGNNRHNVGLYGEDFKPADNAAELNEQVKTEILQVLLDEYITENPEEAPYARLTDFHIERSFGCYNGFYAFTFENALIYLPAVIEEYWEDVGGVKFCYGDSYYRIRLYKTN